jgi:hypothetical protein
MTTLAPFIRIALRIFGGFLMGAGYVSETDLWIFTDPELVGALALLASEGWYLLAKRYGWSK